VSAVGYEDALAAVEAHLGPKAAKHCRRVAATAATLAVVYDVDADAARLAGLLHDWDREVPRELLADRAQDAGVAVGSVEAASPYLLHAQTGAVAVSEALPGVSAEVLQAISRHTIGAPDMTALDMVVYLADMIEPHRDFPGVEDLRRAVGVVSLGELFALGYQQSMRHLVDRRRRIHPDSVAVWNTLVAGDRS
jgi:predicted HD superfamily hydrolase involved in NAD metabolism